MSININIDSVMAKTEAYARSVSGKLKMKECIEKYAGKGVGTTAAGGRIMTEENMEKAAGKLIEALKNAARGCDLPPSVMEHFDTLSASTPAKLPDGSTVIYVRFGGDLHRESLMPQAYDGAYNIVALLNNGYDEEPNIGKVWGVWRGNRIHGLTQRTGLGFIGQAIRDFNAKSGREFNVTAVAGEDYSV